MADLFAPDIDEGASAMSARDEDRAREAPWAGVALPDAGAEPDEDDAGERPTTGLFGTTPAAVDSLRLDAADDDLDLALRDDDSSDVAAPPAARVRRERKVMILPVLLLVLILGAASAYLLRDRLFSGLLQEPDQATPEAPATGLERDSTAEAPAPSPPPIETSPSPAEPAPVTAAPVPVPPPPSVEPRPPPPVVTAPPVVAAPPPPAARPDPPPEPAPGTGFSRLVDISWRPTASGILVVLAADGAIPRGSIRQFRLGGDSPREVIVLSGVRAGYGKTRMAVGDERLTAIRTGYHPGRGDGELHVVLDLATADVRVAAARNLGRSLEIEITSP